MRNLSIEEKVGQMLCFAFHGTTYNDQLATFIKEFKLGGIVYFARNIKNVKETAQLNQIIQNTSEIPLFISLDQEGGSVLRIMDTITSLPGAMALAASHTDKILELTKAVGSDLKKIGFNINFAPVGDVNNNPYNPVINSRAYSDDPEVVAKCATEAFKGFQESRILPTIKHFPGHGNTSVDSHIGLPVVKNTKEEVEKCELIPFKKVIDEQIDGVMISHILYQAYDEIYPASLSHQIITKLLKNQLGFKGLIVTDSLTMGAIYNTYSKEEIILKGVNAGNDILIFCGKADINEQREIYQTFCRLVKEGKISVERVDESVDKILKLKKKYCEKTTSVDDLGNQKNQELAKKIQENAITLVKSTIDVVIKKTEKTLLIFPEIKLASLVDNEDQKYQTLGKFLDVDEIIINQETNLSSINKIIDKYQKIIFATYNVSKNDYQQQVFNLLDKHKTIVVSMRSPYDYLHLTKAENYICIYEATKESFKALARALKGEIPFRGKLPVKLEVI